MATWKAGRVHSPVFIDKVINASTWDLQSGT